MNVKYFYGIAFQGIIRKCTILIEFPNKLGWYIYG